MVESAVCSKIEDFEKAKTSLSEEFLSFVDKFYRVLKHASAQQSEMFSIDETIRHFFASNSLPKTFSDLKTIFSLSLDEHILLFLCATVEIKPEFTGLYADLTDSYNLQYITLDLGGKLLKTSLLKCLSNQSPLFQCPLLQIDKRSQFSQAPLRIIESILCYLLDIPFVDSRISSILKYVYPGLSHEKIPHSQQSILPQIQRHFEDPLISVFLQLLGEDDIGKEKIIARVCRDLGKKPVFLEGALLPDNTNDLQQFVRFLHTEAKLKNLLYVICFQEVGFEESLERKKGSFLFYALSYLSKCCLFLCRQPITAMQEHVVSLSVEKPSLEERMAQFFQICPLIKEAPLNWIGNLIEHFDLSERQMHAIAISLQNNSESEKTLSKLQDSVWNFCRQHSRIYLNDPSQRFAPKLGWKDIVLSEHQKEVLESMVSQVKQRYQVYREWGFAKKESRGLGIISLFYGPSGTGKTMAAEVIAQALELDVYQVNISKIVSKYIGETQKNLEEILSAAEKGSVVLLFDEADALFGKRGQVKEGRDRYFNMEINYLLYRIENYRGLSILTTNLKSNIDSAFHRRFHYILEFSYPTQEQRLQLWKSYFPNEAPRDFIDFEQLARITLTGANIRNIVLNAAFQASAAGAPINMSHVKRAIKAEYLKIEKPLTENEWKPILG
jgi:AAA+ superfamily predicted ATPase